MKRILSVCLISLFGLISITTQAQSEVASTNMLYNAPYRHYINPAFEPMTDGYFYLPMISHLSLYGGNNSWSLKDLVINQDGKTMWTLNPESRVNPLSSLRPTTLVNANLNVALLGFGWRTRHNGYMHVNLNERVDAGVTLPRGIFDFVLGGGMTNTQTGNHFDFKSLGIQAQMYTELAVGYSQNQGDLWTWGFKVKALAGHVYAGMKNNSFNFDITPDQWQLQGAGTMALAGPLKTYPTNLNAQNLFNGGYNFQEQLALTDVSKYFNGWGGAIDFGVTVKPIKILKISASLTDIGVIYWNRGMRYSYTIDGAFTGLGAIQYSDYTDAQGKFDGQRFSDTISARMKTVYENAIQSEDGKAGFWAPLTMKLNASVEVNLVNDIIGLGVYSRTLLYNRKLYEELTFGASVRPASWFNFGVSYSFLNGKWSNLGVGLGLRGGPFILTLAADYVPLTFASVGGKNVIPYKTQGVNFEMGLGIVWGWKRKVAAVETPAL